MSGSPARIRTGVTGDLLPVIQSPMPPTQGVGMLGRYTTGLPIIIYGGAPNLNIGPENEALDMVR